MKSLITRMAIAAVALACAAGLASAQSMKAEVPFAFQASGRAMPAGAYNLSIARSIGGTPVFRLLNTDVKRPVLAMTNGPHDSGNSSDRSAKLVFRCSAADCALVQIWTGTDRGAFDLPAGKTVRGEAALIVVRAEVGE